mmetsp:Transcript_16954/g.69186  ORF Transcript_16954/g.69186 Transcript_16954/m.69186 type:complete len:221 (-) Transcript_16954:545-1207(-)
MPTELLSTESRFLQLLRYSRKDILICAVTCACVGACSVHSPSLVSVLTPFVSSLVPGIAQSGLGKLGQLDTTVQAAQFVELNILLQNGIFARRTFRVRQQPLINAFRMKLMQARQDSHFISWVDLRDTYRALKRGSSLTSFLVRLAFLSLLSSLKYVHGQSIDRRLSCGTQKFVQNPSLTSPRSTSMSRSCPPGWHRFELLCTFRLLLLTTLIVVKAQLH